MIEPVLPVVRRPHEPLVCLVVVLRCRVLRPGERGVERVALLHERPRGGARALEPEIHVADEAKLDVAALGVRDRLVVAGTGVLPARVLAPVVEHRLAVEVDLNLAVHAAQEPQQHMVRVIVGRRATVGRRALGLVVPGADQQHVAHDDPPAARSPARLEHHRAGQVAARDRHVAVRGPDAEAARVAIEDRAEDARRVHPRQAHPLDVAAWSDERRGLAVG